MRLHTMILAASLALSSAALAAGTNGHAHGVRHGGIVEDVDGIQYELVLKPDSIRIYLDDHGQKVSTKSAKGEATILKGSERVKVALAPAGANALEANPTCASTALQLRRNNDLCQKSALHFGAACGGDLRARGECEVALIES